MVLRIITVSTAAAARAVANSPSAVTKPCPAVGAIKDGDVILSVDGQAIDTPRDLMRIIAGLPAGSAAKIELWRERAKLTQNVTLGARPKDEVAALPRGRGEREEGVNARALGVALSPITRELRERYEIPASVIGVVVTDLSRNGPAEQSGLRPGDVIQKVGSKAVTNASQVEAELRAQAGQRRAVLLQINRQGAPLFLALRAG